MSGYVHCTVPYRMDVGTGIVCGSSTEYFGQNSGVGVVIITRHLMPIHPGYSTFVTQLTVNHCTVTVLTTICNPLLERMQQVHLSPLNEN